MLLNCRKVTELLSEAQERKLTLKQRIALKIHLMWCDGCRDFRRQIVAIRRISRAYAKGEDAHSQKNNELP